ncbi:hypothetical protein [Conexibacter sp. CPCC 206217]|uniref:hypothetical protein n=1 Tax=Conexibacter sp. CPCC 206217 TaxID=3064574 RepID=UPI00271FB7FC|nr:hypothetical protein [Conexibacter sp. CPCC 206217]MDO8212835.1 hypothetical protein [Conexibacter sp. CPCC 206217]
MVDVTLIGRLTKFRLPGTIVTAATHAAAVEAARRRAEAQELPARVGPEQVTAATRDDIAEYRSARGLSASA